MATTTRKRKHTTVDLTVHSLKKRKYAVALMEGKTPAQAAREAGYKYTPRNRPERDADLNRWMTELGEEFNVTPRKVMQRISEGLDAMSSKVTPKGQVFEVEDYFVRHRYVETSLKILDMLPPSKNQVTSGEGGVVVRLTPALSDNPHEVFGDGGGR